MARLIPVIDVMGGQVVRAVGGRRSEYKPLVSRLTASTEPVDVAKALLDASGATELYLADLDTIGGHPHIFSPNLPAVGQLARMCPRLWVDYGHRNDFDETDVGRWAVTTTGDWAAGELFEADLGLVIGSETAEGVGTFVHTTTMHAPGEVVLSVDLHAGQLRCNRDGWGLAADDPPESLVGEACAFGLRRVLLLDTAAVGEEAGPVLLSLVGRVKSAFPSLEVWTGGGIRDRDDVRRATDAGADAVLVASALHAGALP